MASTAIETEKKEKVTIDINLSEEQTIQLSRMKINSPLKVNHDDFHYIFDETNKNILIITGIKFNNLIINGKYYIEQTATSSNTFSSSSSSVNVNGLKNDMQSLPKLNFNLNFASDGRGSSQPITTQHQKQQQQQQKTGTTSTLMPQSLFTFNVQPEVRPAIPPQEIAVKKDAIKIENNLEKILRQEDAKTGPIQISLSWHDYNDLD
jgi:hypothetical protein